MTRKYVKKGKTVEGDSDNPPSDEYYTLLPMHPETKRMLENLGNMTDTFDSVICRLIMHANTCQIFWEEKN